MKKRIEHYNSTACYLKKDNKVLMIKFNNKWGQVYSPPGGKFEEGETPLDCILREFKEETGLTLINPRLQGLSCWKGETEGIIFIFTCNDYIGTLTESSEGKLEWIDVDELDKIKQFDQNKIFTSELFKESIFEGKFLINENIEVTKSRIRKI